MKRILSTLVVILGLLVLLIGCVEETPATYIDVSAMEAK